MRLPAAVDARAALGGTLHSAAIPDISQAMRAVDTSSPRVEPAIRDAAPACARDGFLALAPSGKAAMWPFANSHLAATWLMVALVLPAPISLALSMWHGYVWPSHAVSLGVATAVGYVVGRWRQVSGHHFWQLP